MPGGGEHTIVYLCRQTSPDDVTSSRPVIKGVPYNSRLVQADDNYLLDSGYEEASPHK